MRSTSAVYVTNQAGYDKLKERLKSISCPRCRAVGFLIRHGYLRGYCEGPEERIQRGWRVFCSNRDLRKGCGKTYPVLLTQFIPGRVVQSRQVWLFLSGMRQGMSVKAAWEKTCGWFCLETGYRLIAAFKNSSFAIRSILLRANSSPGTKTADPVLQVIEHLLSVFPESACPVAEYQLRFQKPFLMSGGLTRSG